MIKFPIFITTSDPELEKFNEKRYIYFVQSINSLEKTNVDLSNLHIFDDHSLYADKLRFLLTKSWQYKVWYRPENLGPTLNTIYAINYMYKKFPESEYMVFLQDDVIFSKNWLEKGIKTFEKINKDVDYKRGGVGILCLYNRIWNVNDDYKLFLNGHPGGVAWIIKREFWTNYLMHYKIDDNMGHMLPKNEMTRHKIRNLIDHKLCTRAHEIGWDNAIVGKSLVQHIGDRSSLGNRDMTQHRSKNFVGEG